MQIASRGQVSRTTGHEQLTAKAMWIYGLGDLPGQLVVISGPSGTGKSTLIRALLARKDVKAILSISATTRSARLGESHGVDYYFKSREEFEEGIRRNEFL